jgi:esterase/lipase superfamily enzyme
MKPAFKAPPGEEKSALVFIHGYNVKFNDAVVRAAQIGFDLKMSGPTALFSWPSKGTLTDYLADHDSVEYSEDYLAEFLIKMVAQSGSNRIHIIAHSMGNRGLLKCLSVVLQKLKKTANLKFGQIFLAAPDIDADLFGQLCAGYKKLGQRTTLYVSSKDKALAASSRFRGKQRVGFGPPILTFDDIDTIDVSHLDLTFLAHSYYAEAAEVIYDIFDALKGNPPEKRLRLACCPTKAGHCYWRVKK